MPLLHCPDCGRLVSSHADACPHCGRRLHGMDLAKSAPLHREAIKERTWATRPEDILDRLLLLEERGQHHHFRFYGANGSNPAEQLLGVVFSVLPTLTLSEEEQYRYQTDYTVNWQTGLLFVQKIGPLRGQFKMLSAEGKTYLLTPSGYVEHLVYQV